MRVDSSERLLALNNYPFANRKKLVESADSVFWGEIDRGMVFDSTESIEHGTSSRTAKKNVENLPSLQLTAVSYVKEKSKCDLTMKARKLGSRIQKIVFGVSF